MLPDGTGGRVDREVLALGELLEGELRLGHDDLRLTGEQRVDLRVGVGDEVDLHSVDVRDVAGVGDVGADGPVVVVVAHQVHLDAALPRVEDHGARRRDHSAAHVPLGQRLVQGRGGLDRVGREHVRGVDLAEQRLPAGEERRPGDGELGGRGDLEVGDRVVARAVTQQVDVVRVALFVLAVGGHDRVEIELHVVRGQVIAVAPDQAVTQDVADRVGAVLVLDRGDVLGDELGDELGRSGDAVQAVEHRLADPGRDRQVVVRVVEVEVGRLLLVGPDQAATTGALFRGLLGGLFGLAVLGRLLRRLFGGLFGLAVLPGRGVFGRRLVAALVVVATAGSEHESGRRGEREELVAPSCAVHVNVLLDGVQKGGCVSRRNRPAPAGVRPHAIGGPNL